MEQLQIELLKINFNDLTADAELLVDEFYDNLFEIQPDLESMFPADLTEQKKKLFAAIGMVVNGLDKFDEMAPVLNSLGQQHVEWGVSIEDYEYVGEALLKALKSVNGDAWSEELELVWSQAYSMISDAMQSISAG